MSTSLVIGVWLVGALCILCLVASMVVLIKAQELHSRCVDILVVVHDWLEQSRYIYEKEENNQDAGRNA